MKDFGAIILATFIFFGCKGAPPRTSSDASISEVTFLSLPQSASAIHYWDDGHSRIAKFMISEVEFRSLFAPREFAEIIEPIAYEGDVFGDSSKRPAGVPDHGSETARSGLIYQRIESDGGGETIIYDRAAGIAYYDSAPW